MSYVELNSTPSAPMARFVVQGFFEQYRDEAAKPHAGEQFKEFVRNLLLRAQEKELYKP